MAPLFDFARSFIDTCLSAGFPTQLVDDMVNGDLVLDGDMIKKILLDYIGYAIAVVLGFLFVLLFPLIGCCFCCCRNCCRACCDRPKTVDPKASCKVKVYGSIFFVMVTFTIAGNACVYVSNDRITTALDKVTGTVDDNLDDFDLFLKSAEKQIDQIGANFNATTTEIDKQLDSTAFSQTLSEYAVSSLTGGAVQRLQDSAESAKANIDDINTELTNQNFIAAINMMQAMPGVTGIAVPTITLPTVDTTILTDITSDLKNSVNGATTGIQTQLDDAKKQVSDMSTQVNSVVNGMKDTVENVRNSNLDSIKDTVGDTVDTIKPFDHYRWIAGVVIGGIISLIVGLQFFGLGLGVCGSCGSPPEDSKGCMSNSGGRMIIASIIFIFLFAWLLMLLTTLLFAVGALTEKFMCQPLKDPQLTDIESIMKDFVDIKTMLKYNREPPSLGTILSSCKQNQAIYSALQMDKMGNLVDFPALEAQIKQAKLDMKTQLDNVTTQLSGGSFGGVNLNPSSVTTKLDQTKTVIEQLDVDGIELKITGLKNKVDTLASLPVLTSTQKQQMTALTASLNTIQQKLVPLRSLKTSIGPLVTDVKYQLGQATTQINTGGIMTGVCTV
ncbi:Prominin-1 [Mizuhopecten yessoensis]|uniref:Prominin-1 n=1 Tax=Mizuhopecten yessoensis TaxID=6573 RepID=A0A210QI84_MIZYE|nr:Prominin-1 [Mizuhopecten yessoensis]